MDGQHQGVESSSALSAHLATLSRWRLAIAICVVTIPVAAYVWSNEKPAVFEGAVQLKVQPSTVDTSLLNDFNQVFSGPAAALAAAREIKTTAVAEEAIGKLPPGFASTSAALGLITVQVAPDSGIVTLVARGSSGQRAAALANAFARSFVERRLRSATRLLDSAIARLNVQRERLKASAAVERGQLSDQIQRFRALRASQGNNASIIEPAHAATSPVSPHPRRTAAVASLVGLLLALLLVRLLTALDRKVRSQEEVERIMDAPVIATVPEKTFSADPGGTVGREAWETLRANLMFFAIDKVISSVLVTSPQMGDGKTTVASNLAVSYALLGKDVILVDADLRRPQVATKFGLSAGAGFTDVLFGEISAVDALVDIDLAAGQGRLRVLASGRVPPNPSELLASSAAQKVFRDLEEQVDILVIDSPPITVVSDAVPLLDLVSACWPWYSCTAPTGSACSVFARHCKRTRPGCSGSRSPECRRVLTAMAMATATAMAGTHAATRHRRPAARHAGRRRSPGATAQIRATARRATTKRARRCGPHVTACSTRRRAGVPSRAKPRRSTAMAILVARARR